MENSFYYSYGKRFKLSSDYLKELYLFKSFPLDIKKLLKKIIEKTIKKENESS